MTTRKKIKRRVIELIHDENSGEYITFYDKNYSRPITIGRVMQALDKVKGFVFNLGTDGYITDSDRKFTVLWQLVDDKGHECTVDNQTDETVKRLYEVIK